MYKVSKNDTLKMLAMWNIAELFDCDHDVIREALKKVVEQEDYKQIVDSLVEVTDKEVLDFAVKSYVKLVVKAKNSKE